MYAALSQGGELDGARLLSRRAISLATELQPKVEGRSVLPIDMGWRLGGSIPSDLLGVHGQL